MDDYRLRQLLKQTDSAIALPKIGDLVSNAIRRRSRWRRNLVSGTVSISVLVLAFCGALLVKEKNRSVPISAPSHVILTKTPDEPMFPLSEETEFRLRQVILAQGVDGLPPWHPMTIQQVDVPGPL